MNAIVRVVLISLLGMTTASDAYARKWTDVTGRYAVEADLIARNDELAVLQRVDDKKLVSVDINELSKQDQQYLNENKLVESDRAAEGLHDWNLSNGLKVRARVVGYGRRELVLQRRSGKLLVNDRRFENLPEIYQRMIPKIVGHINESKIDSPESLQRWMRGQHGKPRRFMCEGVMLELETGDSYGVPFFFFSTQEQQVLKAGWEQWLAAEQDSAERERENLYAESQAAMYQRDQATSSQIAQLQLGLLATMAGVVDIWEVYLTPASGNGWPISVIVPARNSRDAVNAAISNNPGFVAGPVRKAL